MGMNPRLLRPTASGFRPSQISGLFGWYDATVASSVAIQTGVQSWGDLAGSMGAATQNTTNNQPAYGSVTLNGKPTITFDGSNDLLRTGTFTLAQPYMMFAVFRFEVAPSGTRVLEMGDAASRSGEIIGINDAELGLFSGGTKNGNLTPAAGLLAFAVHDFTLNGASTVVRYNGSDITSLAGNAGTNGANQLTLAANRLNSLHSNVSFGEFIVYSRILSAAEAAKVRQYLRSKWAI